MTIYIDIVLLENIIMNFIILLATGLILKEKIKAIKEELGEEDTKTEYINKINEKTIIKI